MNARKRNREWRPGRDYRIICSCQRHARANSVWRRSLRIASRGVALLVGVPLAFAAFDFPVMEAMGLDLRALRPLAMVDAAKVSSPRAGEAAALPIFNTPRTKAQLLSDELPEPPRLTTPEAVKENFFRTQVPFGSIIYREARRNNLPPELVAAIVHTESDFRAGLVSHKSAQGLMQLVPETARLLGVRDPFDPEQNIAAGTRYLRHLMNRFSDQRLALAAYNAGETKVARLGTIPDYEETRNYVEKVSRRTSHYRQRVRYSYLAASRVRAAE